MRTQEKNCAYTDSALFRSLPNGGKCFYNTYTTGKKQYDPIYYSHQGVEKFLSYGTAPENRINSDFNGYYTGMDGSGYMILLDQENQQELTKISS